MNSKHNIQIVKRRRLKLLFLLVAICCCLIIVYPMLQRSFGVSPEHNPYNISASKSDTILIAMIGDSWAEIHDLNNNDSIFETLCARLFDRPIKCIARGQGGRMTREVYDDMFVERKERNALQNTYFTRPLLELHPDYCVIMSGINDVWQQRSTNYYVGNYANIIRFLLRSSITPVVLEIPNVNVRRAINGCGFIQKSYYRIVSSFTDTEWDNIELYRNAMRKMLNDSGLKDSVIFISAMDWDISNKLSSNSYYRNDEMHLTADGYRALDSCIVEKVIEHIKEK